MKLHIRRPHPKIAPKHVKHAAGGFTIAAATIQLLPLPHILEPILFGLAGIIAIYEPYFVTEIHVIETDGEEA